jgi:vacuolar-type H+-ATPase subunit D/Vma8
MWIKRQLFERLLTDKARAEGQALTLAQRITAQDATIDWMKVQLTKSEYERAQLIQNYMGVKIPVIEMTKTEPSDEKLTVEKVLAATVDFSDIGDDAAKAMGLDWDSEGRLTQHGKLVQ